jgi:two-component system chemotaxis response regulator CheY
MSKSILIVDDSPSIRQMVAFTLKRAGYQVVDAADGLAGLAKAKGGHFDLVVSDINMPGLDGFGLTEALRALDAYKTTPILVLTTEASDSMKQRGKAAGATGWLVKPFDPQKLLELVWRVIG